MRAFNRSALKTDGFWTTSALCDVSGSFTLKTFGRRVATAGRALGIVTVAKALPEYTGRLPRNLPSGSTSISISSLAQAVPKRAVARAARSLPMLVAGISTTAVSLERAISATFAA